MERPAGCRHSQAEVTGSSSRVGGSTRTGPTVGTAPAQGRDEMCGEEHLGPRLDRPLSARKQSKQQTPDGRGGAQSWEERPGARAECWKEMPCAVDTVVSNYQREKCLDGAAGGSHTEERGGGNSKGECWQELG